jgi:hypothetical protein
MISQTLCRRLIAAAVDLERAKTAWADDLTRARKHGQAPSPSAASRYAHAARTALDLQETAGFPAIADPAYLRACMAHMPRPCLSSQEIGTSHTPDTDR